MKLSKQELSALFRSVARDANKQISVRNYTTACCGGYCSGTCCTSGNGRN